MKHDNHHQNTLDKLNILEAFEQTFSAWLQTGLTLIGLGFAVGSIIAFMEESHYEKTMIKAIRIIGQKLILIGLFTLVLALIHYRIKLKSLSKKHGYKEFLSPPVLIGMMMIVFGIVSFVSILMHIIY